MNDISKMKDLLHDIQVIKHSTMVRHTSTTTREAPKRRLPTTPTLVIAAGVTLTVGLSWYVRTWRQKRLQELDYITTFPQQRYDLIETMERTGQMGITGARSVKEELESIRKWHIEHGFKGGLVLRELTQPVFTSGEGSAGIFEKLEDLALDPMQLARRECYYLYYEITGNGQIRQQIFCRGTTLAIDILTCLSFWMVYDEDLGCRVHLGFRNQADRILEDIAPLLAPADDERTTIEVSGHSLGGAVAYILAAKLRKRGYRVIRVTALASPRFCASASAVKTVEDLLPKDNLRIENDTDVVPLLPPFGHSLGNKLFLINESGQMAYISSSNPVPWVDSALVNFRVMESFVSGIKTHRVPYHIAFVKRALKAGQD